MKTKVKIKSYGTNKVCCKKHKSIIEVKIFHSDLGESYSAECTDCGNVITGLINVRNLLVTTNPVATSYLLNKANFN